MLNEDGCRLLGYRLQPAWLLGCLVVGGTRRIGRWSEVVLNGEEIPFEASRSQSLSSYPKTLFLDCGIPTDPVRRTNSHRQNKRLILLPLPGFS